MRLRVLVTSVALALVSITPTSAAAATPGHLEAAVIREAKAQQLARAGVLRRHDLPGYSAQAPSRPSAREADRARYRCLGTSPPSVAARHDGRAFTRGRVRIGSAAFVLGTPERARADLARLATPRGLGCYGEAISTLFTAQGAEVQQVLIERTAVEVVPAGFAVGFRYEVRALLEGVVVRIRGIDVHAQVGATELTVSSTRTDARQPSLRQVEKLASKAARRVAAV